MTILTNCNYYCQHSEIYDNFVSSQHENCIYHLSKRLRYFVFYLTSEYYIASNRYQSSISINVLCGFPKVSYSEIGFQLK